MTRFRRFAKPQLPPLFRRRDEERYAEFMLKQQRAFQAAIDQHNAAVRAAYEAAVEAGTLPGEVAAAKASVH